MTLSRSQDFWAGVLFIAFGLITIWVAWDYPLGSARRMGAGYYPMLIAAGLCAMGAILMVRGWLNEGERIDKGALRPFLTMIAVVAFAFLLRPAGLIVAVLALILGSAFAGREFRPLETIASAIFLAVFAAVVFMWGLELPVTLFPER